MTTPSAQNLVARIPGRGTGPSLLLLGHTDVVVADPNEWTVPPFGGVDRDDYIWGRGALDMKGQVAAETVAFASLAREGWQGNGDLVLCSVADEEVSVGIGASWIVEARPDLVRTDYVLNEGGGERIEHNGRIVYNVDVGEKMCSAFEITVHGRSGHASGAFIVRQRTAQDRSGDRADRADGAADARPARAAHVPGGDRGGGRRRLRAGRARRASRTAH